jgi:uncharacterized membrane protein
MNNRKYVIFSILVLFFLSALIMLRQLMPQAYFSCIIQDTFEHTGRAWQFIKALKEGIIYPRWAPLKFWGYGSPIFVLYPPLAFYLVAFFNIFTDSVISAMNIAKFTALFLSGTGMFFLVREFYSERIALKTASFYIIFPYNIFGLYYMGTFASLISLMWFSPILLFTYRYIKGKQYKYIIYAGLCYGGLILTHLINAYMFSFVLIAFVTYMSITKKRLKDLIVIPSVITIGFLISSAYIRPLIYERQFINLEALTGEGSYFADFFILPNLTSKLPSGSFWPVYYNTFIFHIFFFFILILLFLLQIIKLSQVKTMKDVNAVNKFFLGTAIGSLFLLFGISTFIWKAIPFFDYISFPYRWLNITTFAIVFLSASAVWVFKNIYKSKRGHKFFMASLFLVCLLLDYKYIKAANMFTEEALIPVKTENWVTAEYLPIWVDIEKIDKKEDFKERAVVIKGEGKANVVTWSSAERVIELVADQPITVRIRTFNFPGWKAYVDGKQTEIRTEEGAGAMLIDIPKGKYTLVLKFEDTPLRYYSKLISLFSFAIMILISLFLRKNR